MLGGKERVEENKATNFMLFNKPLFSHDVTLKLCIICPTSFDFGPFKKLLDSTSANLGLRYCVAMNKINYGESKGTMKEI